MCETKQMCGETCTSCVRLEGSEGQQEGSVEESHGHGSSPLWVILEATAR